LGKETETGGGYSLPDNIFASLIPGKTYGCRGIAPLILCALTRAEQHLIISYCTCNNEGKEMEPSMFIAEILDKHVIPVEKVIVDDEIIDEFAILHFGEEQMRKLKR
jgi:DNA helicase-2/ATP-dependent DNA helicase PcrA